VAAHPLPTRKQRIVDFFLPKSAKKTFEGGGFPAPGSQKFVAAGLTVFAIGKKEAHRPVVVGQYDVNAGTRLTNLSTFRVVEFADEVGVRPGGIYNTLRSDAKLVTYITL